MKLIEYLKSIGASTCKLVSGPNGRFVSYTVDGVVSTLPVGKKSQNGSLAEFNALEAEDGTVIATVNTYKDVEELELAQERGIRPLLQQLRIKIHKGQIGQDL